MAMLFARCSPRCALTAVVIIVSFCCATGNLTAQVHEPDIRIDVRAYKLQFSANGEYLLVTEWDRVRRYNLARHRFDAPLSLSFEDKFAIDADGDRLARIDAESPQVEVIDLVSGNVLYTLPYPNLEEDAYLVKMAFAGNNTLLLVIASYDPEGVRRRYLYYTDIGDGAWHTVSLGDRKTTDFLPLSSDHNKLLMSDTSHTEYGEFDHMALRVFRMTDDVEGLISEGRQWVLTDEYDWQHYRGSAWFEDRPIVLLSKVRSDDFIVFDIQKQKVLFSWPGVDPAGTLRGAILSPNGRWLGIMRYHNGIDYIECYELRMTSQIEDNAKEPNGAENHLLPRLVQQLSLNPHFGTSNSGLAVSQEGRILAVSGVGGLTLWERTSGVMFRHIANSEGTAVALSKDGSLVVSDMPDGIGVWDVASGKLLAKTSRSHFGTTFFAFLDDGRILECKFKSCVLQDESLDYSLAVRVELDGLQSDATILSVSLAPDEASVALELGEGYGDNFSVGWMELRTDGRQRIIPVSQLGGVRINALAALGGTTVAVGLSDGKVSLIDALTGNVLKTRHIQGMSRITNIIRLDDERLAVVSGQSCTAGDGSPGAAIFIVSIHNLSVLHYLNRNQSGCFFFLDGAASDDGRWLVLVSDSFVDTGPPVAHWWDTVTLSLQALGSNSVRTENIRFNENGDWIVVSGSTMGSLVHLKEGRAVRRFDHNCFMAARDGCPAVTNDAVVYVAGHEGEGDVDEGTTSTKIWSVRSGLNDLAIPDGMVRQLEWIDRISVDGSHVAIGIRTNGDGSVVFPAKPKYLRPMTILSGVNALLILSLDDAGRRGHRIDRVNLSSFHIEASTDRVLLHFYTGVEMLDALRGESMWLRDDLHFPKLLGFTADRTGVVVKEEGSGRLLILESGSGETRLGLPETVTVISDAGVQGLLRLTDDHRVERLSLHDGTALSSVDFVIDSVNFGLPSLEFVVSNNAGTLYLMVGSDSQAMLWDTISGERTVFETTATGPEKVAFSPGGQLMAVTEAEGSVGLWDVSSGPDGLRRLARLITFDSGEWAVVGEDGRYDASDPADLDGLAWVMPDAPTEPVPLTIFYREYYEPRLLQRLLDGEVFAPIDSLIDLDRTQPQVEIAAVEPVEANYVDVTVEVRKSGANGVHDLKLFRDGRLVGFNDLAGQSNYDARDAWQVTFSDIALPTMGADSVEFSAYAFNADKVKSDTHRFSYTLPEVEPSTRRAFVIVAGVNAYQNPSWDLRYAAEDARAAGDIVTRYLQASKEFEEVHTIMLTTIRDTTGDIIGTAARADLLAVLDVLAGEEADLGRLKAIPGAESLAKAQPDDLVYLAFSGHGLSGGNGLFHLFMSDIGDGIGRVVDDTLLERTLDSDLLARHLLRVDAGDFVIVIDACNAAASVEGDDFKPGPMGSRGLGQLAYDKAMRVLAASQAEEAALESDQLRHGLLTFAMLREGLEGGSADRAPEDQVIDFAEMLNYGVERVPLLYDDIRNGSFAPQGRGLTPFRPSAQLGSLPVQRPNLFDFSRGERKVRMPVIDD